jgi:hypothetical protein
MSERMEPTPEQSGPPTVDYQVLMEQAQAAQPDSEPASPERQRHERESLTAVYLNTSFSGVFDHPDGLDALLLRDHRPRENAVFGFSEVTHAQRPAVRAALEARGYQVVEPPEDSHLDLVWAVSPELQVETSDVHHFPRNGLRRVASRTGSKTYRHVGIQDLTVMTPQGNKVRLGQERLSPWVVEPVRRLQLRDMDKVLEEQFAPDEDIILTINGGDMNHVGPLRKPDRRLWESKREQGWEPVLEPGTPTHTSADKYRVSGALFRAAGRKSDETQLDAVYARPRSGTVLVKTEDQTQLTNQQIGYRTEVLRVAGTDHYAIATTYSIPPRDTEANSAE